MMFYFNTFLLSRYRVTRFGRPGLFPSKREQFFPLDSNAMTDFSLWLLLLLKLLLLLVLLLIITTEFKTHVHKMAKSLRSKRKRKFRAIKRMRLKPKLDAKLREIAIGASGIDFFLSSISVSKYGPVYWLWKTCFSLLFGLT